MFSLRIRPIDLVSTHRPVVLLALLSFVFAVGASDAQAPAPSVQDPPHIRPLSEGDAARILLLEQAAHDANASGRHDQAEEALRALLGLHESSWGPNHVNTTPILRSLADNLHQQGRYREEEALYRRVMTILGARSETEHIAADVRHRLGVSLLSQGRPEEASGLLGTAAWYFFGRWGITHPSAEEPFRDLVTSYNLQGMAAQGEGLLRWQLEGWRGNADALQALAVNLDYQGRYMEAGLLHQQVLRTWRAQSPRALMGAGLNLHYQGRDREAEPLLREAAALQERALGANHPETAEALHALALSVASQGNSWADAEWLERRALAVQEARLGTDHLSTTATREGLAFVMLARGRPQEAESLVRAVLNSRRSRAMRLSIVTEQLQRRTSAAELMLARAVWERSDHTPSDEAFMATQIAGDSQAAQASAFGIMRSVAEENNVGDLASTWLSTQYQIAFIDRRIVEAASRGADAERTRLQTERIDAVRGLEASERDLRERFPRFFDLITATAVPQGDAQSVLRGDEALLLLTPGSMELPPGHRRGLVFAVTLEGAAWAEIPLEPDALASEIGALHDMLQSGGATRSPGVGSNDATISGARGYDRARAHRLYQTLFGAPEVARLIQSKTHWVLAPQGALLSAPYAALVTQAPETGTDGDADPADLRATHWLGLDRTLQLTPSISALKAQRQDRASIDNSPSAFFGLGDPSFDGQPGPSRGLNTRSFFRDANADVNAVRQLPRLPGTRAEIERLAQAFGASRNDYVLDVAATEAEINRRNADGRLSRARVIAFATHGLMAGDLSGSLAEPALALTPPATASEADDGLLTASEAARLRLTARWVILSACNTAAGGRPDAEGLTGLARAFFHAGARTLLVTQWPVDDQAAQRLTTDAVALQRQRNLRAADAMRQAMVELAADTANDNQGRSFAHPSAWAPFVLVSGE